MERRGVSLNVASFVGATTVRIHELGEKDVDPAPAELARMRSLVRQAMNEGAMGVGSSLIYAPANFAETPELIALAAEAGRCGGMYISHIRDEGPKLLEAIDELIEISAKSGAPAEIYHFKQSGRENWPKIDAAIGRVEAARARGMRITADMYTYPASSTGFDAAFPLWIQDGGIEAWVERLKDPKQRAKAFAEMHRPDASENTKLVVQEPDKVLLVGFKTDALKPLTGKTLAEVAKERGQSAEQTAAELIVADGTRIQVVYFGMSEANVAREVTLPWMSFGSDAGAQAPEGVFLKSSTHPRAYGTFARLLGKYVRDERRAAAGRSGPAPGRAAGGQSQDRRPRAAQARPFRRHRGVRPGRHRRPRDLRQAAAICGRHAPRVRQRRRRAARRRAHRRDPGPLRPRAGVEEVLVNSSLRA